MQQWVFFIRGEYRFVCRFIVRMVLFCFMSVFFVIWDGVFYQLEWYSFYSSEYGEVFVRFFFQQNVVGIVFFKIERWSNVCFRLVVCKFRLYFCIIVCYLWGYYFFYCLVNILFVMLGLEMFCFGLWVYFKLKVLLKFFGGIRLKD